MKGFGSPELKGGKGAIEGKEEIGKEKVRGPLLFNDN
jgi:hypothetical protein